MFLFGHIGCTAFVAKNLRKDIDLRKVAFLSIAPDLFDKPLGLLYPEFFGNNTRLAAHTVWASLLVFAYYWIRRRTIPAWAVFTFSYCFHVVLDQVWIHRNLKIFLFPFLGPVLRYDLPAVERWGTMIHHSWSLWGEVIGISILVFYFFKYRLFEKSRRIDFIRSGVLK